MPEAFFLSAQTFFLPKAIFFVSLQLKNNTLKHSSKMKKALIIACAALLFVSANAQTSTTEKPVVKKANTCRMSGLSAFLYVDLMELEKADPSLKSIPNEMKDRYGFRVINSEMYVGAFADIKADKRDLAAQYGVLFNGKRVLPFMTVNIPVKNYVRFINSGIADYIEVGEENVPMMDSAKIHTGASFVQSGYNLPKGYCGKDVVVGIIDIGFHYTHFNFFDSTETTFRVKRVWDQNASSGTPPAGFNYGNELTTQAQMAAAKYSHNNQTHGSHVAGMAAGGGTNDSLMKKYKGMAPESDIVLVATTMYSSEIFDGLQYILDYANSVGKPCVVNMSLGNHVGPHDGTDYNEYATDYLFDSIYKKGAALMVSAGNEGSTNLHNSKSFTANDTIFQTFAITKSNGNNKLSGTVDIWGELGSHFRVKVAVADSTSDSATLARLNYPLVFTTEDTIDYTTNVNLGSNGRVSYYVEDTNYYNEKPHVYLYFNGSNLSGRNCFIIRIESTSGIVHLWNNSGIFIGGTAATAGNTNNTTNNRASGRSSLMVASYSTKATWTTYMGRYYNLSYNYLTGSRSYFSSIGPGLNTTLNKPEITGPGALILSSYNFYDTRYDTTHYMITNMQTGGGDTCFWGMMQGTSMSCPAVTGIVALWMEAYPELTYSQVKELMRTTAISDSLTGIIPANGSPYYGWGKINALGGIQTILSRIPAKPAITPATNTVICSGDSITISAPAGYLHYQWNTGDTTQTITTSAAGSYCVRIDSVGGYFSPWSDTITITVRQRFNTTISRDTAICIGESVALAVSGGTSQLWNTGDTTASITVTPSTTTTYIVNSNQTPNFCTMTDSVTVTVKKYVSNWWVSNDTSVCPGEFVTITARGGDSYAWLGVHSGWDTNQSVTVEVMYPRHHIMVRIDSTGLCPVWDSLDLFAYPQPHVDIHNHLGQVADHYGVRWDIPDYSVILTATGQTGQTYLWSTGDTTASITVSPTVPTLYSVVSTTEHGCMDSISVTVLCLTASISTADEIGFNLYPNPASTSVTIEGANMNEITIYNTLGQVVKNLENNEKTTIIIPVNDFARGVYVISVKDSLGKTGRKTFVVK